MFSHGEKRTTLYNAEYENERMQDLRNNEAFLADYAKLARVGLNPERHTAATAIEHCEQVFDAVTDLAHRHRLPPEEMLVLHNLALVHDIGKSHGNARPEESVNMLSRYGEWDDAFVNLVKFHDINLPWFIAMKRGQPPSDAAWNRLARRADLRLLCLFMVADRVDCPGGGQQNHALVWFLDQARKRGLIDEGTAGLFWG